MLYPLVSLNFGKINMVKKFFKNKENNIDSNCYSVGEKTLPLQNFTFPANG